MPSPFDIIAEPLPKDDYPVLTGIFSAAAVGLAVLATIGNAGYLGLQAIRHGKKTP
jgi:hypothetical protein